MTMRGLELQNLQITINGAPLVTVNTTVAPGQVVTIMGPSGVGKSTILAAITGSLAPAFRFSGQVILNGTDVTRLPPPARRIGILFQEELLFPHLSVGANLAFGLQRGAKDRRAVIDAALNDIGLPGVADRDPATLSGGQKARVALMRMLLSDPQALLLDEAFSKLDTDLRAQMRDLVFTHARARDLPVLMVTHDHEDAAAAGGPVITL
ncbi:ATP-binding cassette domain-containing protein [Rhodovulum sp. FJ3]|uniref:ATP-binding cassette domain-containing protein n=1 Tax=Rhodovulum sp. FJ3 TaxID=3079053 RepID=UPI00293DD857|nr:ATP-binding cassette domain-containing protein [Rhodovulum sp. FJ3]MDV4167617.1 ATP-binding cassette domain-containing protein [Rhodovulum sp. FJ3]